VDNRGKHGVALFSTSTAKNFSSHGFYNTKDPLDLLRDPVLLLERYHGVCGEAVNGGEFKSSLSYIEEEVGQASIHI